jgi:DNA-binding PadR family transcriptional regulator
MASTAEMSSSTVVDLALLGLLAERPRLAHDLVGAVKIVGGDRFTPTSAFIEGRLAYLAETGCIERQRGEHQQGERLHATRAGTAHLARLLCLEVDPAAALRAFCTTLKLSLLDLVGTECRREVVETLLCAGRRRLSALEMAQWEERGGPVIERCLALEQEREALELRWLQDVMASEQTGEGIREGIGASAA